MSKQITYKRAFIPLDNLEEQYLNGPEDIIPKPDKDPLQETPHRASAVTPRISDLLDRVQGIQRWGLNE